MSKIIIVFLAVYFISFFGLAVVWRNYAVAKKTGANAFKLNKKIGAEAITGLYFKFLPLVSILVFTLYAFFPTLYQSLGPITLINHKAFQLIGMGIMVVALVWIVVAQSQMGASWRIGIDHDEKTEFIQKGLFRYSRNPIFVGIIFTSFGFFLVLPNPFHFNYPHARYSANPNTGSYRRTVSYRNAWRRIYKVLPTRQTLDLATGGRA